MWNLKWLWTSRPAEPEQVVFRADDGAPSAAPWAYWPDRTGTPVFEPEAVQYHAGATPGLEGTEAAAGVWDLWPVEAARFKDAVDHAPDQAGGVIDDEWNQRVQRARAILTERDPGGVQAWDQVHADADAPHLFEARLLAAFETLRWGVEEAEHLDYQANLWADDEPRHDVYDSADSAEGGGFADPEAEREWASAWVPEREYYPPGHPDHVFADKAAEDAFWYRWEADEEARANAGTDEANRQNPPIPTFTDATDAAQDEAAEVAERDVVPGSDDLQAVHRGWARQQVQTGQLSVAEAVEIVPGAARLLSHTTHARAADEAHQLSDVDSDDL
jgi:hypothetical protein